MDKGKVIKGTGKVLGGMLELNLLLTGAVIGGIVMLAGNKKAAGTIRKSTRVIGRFAGKAAKVSAGILAEALEASKTQSYQLGKTLGKRAVQSKIRIYGDAKQFYNAEKIVEAAYKETK